ncbi:WD40/YVTN/BNR-like repeat-containing protein [Ferroacidibacillus organovorans]|uniref:Photosynthesis system II assembly factor Ycf48/Hcf136-like domain-containing protein n=1 Tax=Ferroacidibacillus organovorans TaxID=1765683 RepID=A0A853KC67_9BACL|nr:hypothetical protein [Ferroacidibacillus organovorans]KYP81526.1 hypothetical protein AYJ22_07295 [Ferroacidibacillus organovorans]OAG94041.1 hypothetical protein AYW79_07355 [Ferroacidibacillus organovorans]
MKTFSPKWIARTGIASFFLAGAALTPCTFAAMRPILHVIPVSIHQSAVNPLQDLAFATPSTGWLAAQGELYATTDGGNHFRVIPLHGLNLTDLTPLNSHTLIAVSQSQSGAQLAISTNGGNSFTTRPLPFNLANSVTFDTLSLGYAISPSRQQPDLGGTLFRTSNGGKTWIPLKTPEPALAVSIDANGFGYIFTQPKITSSNQAGYGEGAFYVTHNGGRSFQLVNRISGPGMIQGAQIKLVKNGAWVMVDGGAGMSQSSYTVFRLVGQQFKPVLALSTAGAGPAPGIPVTHRATPIPQGPGSHGGQIFPISATRAYFVGGCAACGYGTTSVTETMNGGKTWSKSTPIPAANGMGFGNVSAFPSQQIGYLLLQGEQSGTVLRTRDGGLHWQAIYPSPKPSPVLSAQMVTPKLGYGVGIPGAANDVLMTRDSGATWSIIGRLPVHNPLPYSGPSSAQIVAFPSPNVGYIIGSDQHLYKTQDGGKVFVPFALKGGSGRASSIDMQGRFGYIVGALGHHAWLTRNGGLTWLLAASTDPISLMADAAGLAKTAIPVAARAQNANFLALGPTPDSGSFMLSAQTGYQSTSDGGKTWKRYMFPHNQWITWSAMQFLTPRFGYAFSTYDGLFVTTNGGQAWVNRG